MAYRDKARRKEYIKFLTAPSVKATYQLLKDGQPLTVHELADAAGFSVPAMKEAIDSLHFHGEAHIHCYKALPIGGYAAVWTFGPGENAEKPPKQTKEELYAKRKAARVHYEENSVDRKESAYQEAQRALRASFKPHRDPFTAAFFGEAVA